jgi:starch phosphorylase
MPSWDSAEANALWSETSGEARWLDTLETLESELKALPDKTLWDFRGRGRRNLILQVRRRTARQSATHATRLRTLEECARLLDPDTLTLGFARRFATYKRPNLLLHDPARLTRLLTNPQRPVQLILAGKAHPRDQEGKRMVREWNDYLHQAQVRGHVVFLEDYDMALASELVAGVDVWLNTPRRPWEASGTSGMKVLPNGGLNLSELDGWWAEAYEADVGWAIGDGHEHDADPVWDAHEADQLYSLLERKVVPAFYERNGHGIPQRWVEMMRESMARLTPQYSTNRMVREYTEHYYLPAASAYHHRSHDDCALGAEIRQWSHRIADHWERVHFGTLEVSSDAQHHRISVQVYLGELPPDSVSVELYAEPQDGSMPQPRQMEIAEPLAGAANAFLFEAEVPSQRPAEHYTPRIVPYHPDVQIPLEGRAIHWAR